MADQRQIKFESPLGDDLLIVSMSGSEALGRPFAYNVTFYSQKEDLSASDIVGQLATIEIETLGGEARHFNAYVKSFSQVGRTQEAFCVYQAEMVPWIWLLTKTSDCKIFQNLSVPDILKEVFKESGFTDYDFRLTRNYRIREYCVQYRESDFNFFSRLMEEEGIYYFFEHSDSLHTLVVADAYSAHQPIEGESSLKYHLTDIYLLEDEYSVSDWELATAMQTGSYGLAEYDFKKPKSDLSVTRIIERDYSYSDQEIFDFPGKYVESVDGDQYALNRLEELQSNYEVVAAVSDARNMIVGGLFSLEEHPRADQNREYLVTACQYKLTAEQYVSGGVGSGGSEPFFCQIQGIDSSTPFRTGRTTSKPMIRGPQTAVVVGPASEEIYPDEFGRIKVQFYWDRYGQMDENSSCWIRVAQSWAGPNFGSQFLPRIGHEVMVEFLDGDPDRPIITGRVYNADNMPTYDLPGNKTQSGIKSRSSSGGGQSNANEIRMEDKMGSEELFIQAEKDEKINVKNCKSETVGADESITIGNNRTENVGNNETITVGNDREETVGSNETLSVGTNRTRTVGVNESVTVSGNQTLTVSGSRTHSVTMNEMITVLLAQEQIVGGMQSIQVGGAQTTEVGGYQSIEVTGVQSTEVGFNQSLEVGKNQDISVGKNRSVNVDDDDNLKVGKGLVIDAGDSVTIKTGSASISMKKNGDITLKGKNITLKASGKISGKASSSIKWKGSKVSEN